MLYLSNLSNETLFLRKFRNKILKLIIRILNTKIKSNIVESMQA